MGAAELDSYQERQKFLKSNLWFFQAINFGALIEIISISIDKNLGENHPIAKIMGFMVVGLALAVVVLFVMIVRSKKASFLR